MQESENKCCIGVDFGGSDDIKIIILDVDKSDVTPHNNGSADALFLLLQYQRQKFLDRIGCNVSSVVPTDQILK